MATKTHTITGFITHHRYPWQKPGEETIGFTCYRPTHDENTVVMRAHSFDVEVDDGFDPTPGQIAILEEQKRLLRLKLAEDLMAIDEKLSKLQAIGNEVQA